MGISAHLALMLLQEHKYKPITGRVLFIGRQTFNMDIDHAAALVESTLGSSRDVTASVLDTRTRASKQEAKGVEENLISDKSFFSLFSDAEIVAVDVTDYEEADIIHDMTQPLPDHMIGAYDFVINGSCLDNIFDPAAAQRNFGRCLKSNGRLFQVECGSSFSSAYVMFSPEWFYDFYLYNHWHDAKIYVCRTGEHQAGLQHTSSPWDIYYWNPIRKFFDQKKQEESVAYKTKARWIQGLEMIVSIAERGENGTVDQAPIQAAYRPPKDFPDQLQTGYGWMLSDRPLYQGATDTPEYEKPSMRSDFYHYRGTI